MDLLDSGGRGGGDCGGETLWAEVAVLAALAFCYEPPLGAC